MALPQMTTPEFSAVIPSTSQPIKFRPFLVKEEKVLLMALEGNDTSETISAIINILDACILTDVTSDLTLFDVEYLFLKIRGKSVGEVVELKIKHADDTECKHSTDISVNLEEVQVVGEIEKGLIQLTEDVGVKLRYPRITDAIRFAGQTNDPKIVFDLIASCIEYVYDKENIHSQFSEDEIKDWLGQLSQSQFIEISEFFKNVPKLSHELKWTCKECGKDDSITLEGLQNFFV